jgi:hypothetical protein
VREEGEAGRSCELSMQRGKEKMEEEAACLVRGDGVPVLATITQASCCSQRTRTTGTQGGQQGQCAQEHTGEQQH